jgi:hypothetical protein
MKKLFNWENLSAVVGGWCGSSGYLEAIRVGFTETFWFYTGISAACFVVAVTTIILDIGDNQ